MFYEHIGFRVYLRIDRDESENYFLLPYMRLDDK